MVEILSLKCNNSIGHIYAVGNNYAIGAYKILPMGSKRETVFGMLVITYTNGFDELNSDDDFDRIQILSSQVENSDEFFLAPVAGLTKADVLSLDHKETERKRVARVVAFVSGLLFLVSVTLVAVSLYMSKDIDEIGE